MGDYHQQHAFRNASTEAPQSVLLLIICYRWYWRLLSWRHNTCWCSSLLATCSFFTLNCLGSFPFLSAPPIYALFPVGSYSYLSMPAAPAANSDNFALPYSIPFLFDDYVDVFSSRLFLQYLSWECVSAFSIFFRLFFGAYTYIIYMYSGKYTLYVYMWVCLHVKTIFLLYDIAIHYNQIPYW